MNDEDRLDSDVVRRADLPYRVEWVPPSTAEEAVAGLEALIPVPRRSPESSG